MRVAHLSDLHLNGTPPRREPVLRALGQAAKAGADHLLLTGDLTAAGRPHEFAELGQVLGAWPPARVTIVPGNHDGSPEMWATALGGPLARFVETSRPGAVADRGDAVFVAVNTQFPNRAPVFSALGQMPSEQMDLVKQVADAADGRTVVVAMHHGPQWHYLQLFDGLTNGHHVEAMMNEAPNVVVCCGHDHRVLDVGRVYVAASTAHHADPLRLYDAKNGIFEPIYRSEDDGESFDGVMQALRVIAHQRPSVLREGSEAVVNSLAGVASQSTGSMIGDTALGALVGYLAAPETGDKWPYVVGGAFATGLAGLAGLVTTAAVGLSAKRAR